MQKIVSVLREIGKNAAFKGGTALSEFLGRRILLKPSFVDIISVHEIHENIYLRLENLGMMIFSRLHHGVQGELIFILDERTAYRLINLSHIHSKTHFADKEGLGSLTELGVSTIKEIGNIVIGSYLTALSSMLNFSIDTPLSTFLSGSLDRIFHDVLYFPYASLKQVQRYCIQTDFVVPEEDIKGNLSLALTVESGKNVKQAYLENALKRLSK